MKKYLDAYSMFLDFIGFLEDKKGDITLIDTKRFKNALEINTHNHLRLSRILSSLHVMGHMKKAFALLAALKTRVNPKLYEKRWVFYDE